VPATWVIVRSPNRQPLTIVLEGRLEFGREADGLVIVDPLVSRRHATIEPGPDETVIVTDLGSANGTTLDGVPVEGPTGARVGSVVRIGDTRIEIGTTSSVNRTEIHTRARDSGSPRSTIDAVAESVAGGLDAEVLGVRDEPGTLTIAFSDIESSTQLAVAIGDAAWFDVIRRHQELVDAHVRAHRGRIVKNQGDGFMLCFPSARSALLASIGVQRDLSRQQLGVQEHELRVRIGLHTGEVLVDDDGDLVGKHVVVAARIAALAEGGEILVSSLLQQIAEPRGDIPFVGPRSVELRGIGQVETVWAVDWRSFVTN
jgi:class 3 adenylate cyclase